MPSEAFETPRSIPELPYDYQPDKKFHELTDDLVLSSDEFKNLDIPEIEELESIGEGRDVDAMVEYAVKKFQFSHEEQEALRAVMNRAIEAEKKTASKDYGVETSWRTANTTMAEFFEKSIINLLKLRSLTRDVQPPNIQNGHTKNSSFDLDDSDIENSLDTLGS